MGLLNNETIELATRRGTDEGIKSVYLWNYGCRRTEQYRSLAGLRSVVGTCERRNYAGRTNRIDLTFLVKLGKPETESFRMSADV